MNNNQTTGTKIEPKVGETVLYTLEGGKNDGKTRPAIIVEVFNNTGLPATDQGPPIPFVNLQVFMDGSNDGLDSNTGGTLWKTSRHYSPTAMPGTWCYPSDFYRQQQTDLAASQETSFETPELALSRTGRGQTQGGIL